MLGVVQLAVMVVVVLIAVVASGGGSMVANGGGSDTVMVVAWVGQVMRESVMVTLNRIHTPCSTTLQA
jgi:hypothetical protein